MKDARRSFVFRFIAAQLFAHIRPVKHAEHPGQRAVCDGGVLW